MIFDIIHLLCQLDQTFTKSHVIDHPIVLTAIGILSKHPISVLNLLIDLVLTNELFPVQTNSKSIDLNYDDESLHHCLGQLINEQFLKRIFEFIENSPDNEQLVSLAMKFLLSFNLRYEYPAENPLILTITSNLEQISFRTLIEQLIYLLNRNGRRLQ